jgi:hypothetical protein
MAEPVEQIAQRHHLGREQMGKIVSLLVIRQPVEVAVVVHEMPVRLMLMEKPVVRVEEHYLQVR